MPRYVDIERIKYTEYINGDVTVSKDLIEKIPTADVQEVRHGYWTIRYEGTYTRAKCYCSVCGKPNGIGGIIENQKKPYCPNCGAKMDGGVRK